MKELIAFIFRLINFGILIGVFYYLFKKYLLVTIQQKIVDKKQQVQDLVDQQQALEYNQQEMDRTLVQQAQLCTSLKEQVSQWRARIELKLAQRVQEKKEWKAKLIKRTQEQSNWLRQERIKQRVFPVAISQARDDLRKKFSAGQQKHAFIDKIIIQMKKSMS